MPELNQMSFTAVCPACGSDDMESMDKIDYAVWAVKCVNCGWEGTVERY